MYGRLLQPSMETDLNTVRREAHAFLDRLSPDRLTAIRGLMETMLDPAEREKALISVDDEPETEAEREAVAAALGSLDRNGGVPMETVLSDFGLTMADFQAMARMPLDPTPQRGE